MVGLGQERIACLYRKLSKEGAWLEGRLFTAVHCNNRELKQRRRRRQRERQKAVALDWQYENFAHASRFLYISVPSLLDYDVKLPNFTFYGGRGHKQRFFFLLCTLAQFIGIQLLKKSQKFDKLRAGIWATKFEAARIHFSLDVFAAVTVLLRPLKIDFIHLLKT